MSDDKYDKARRQELQKNYAIVVLLTFVVTAFLVFQLVSPKDDFAANKTTFEIPHSQLKLSREVEELDTIVRDIKKKPGVIMETDVDGVEATSKLQEATRRLLKERYGPDEPYRVKVVLGFQRNSPDYAKRGPNGSLLLEMASSELMPHSVFSFLELARNWQGGAFNRIAPHLLQVKVDGGFESVAFQEYSVDFPHIKGTVGFSDRPSGPDWYISTVDNTAAHGPGSQQTKNPYEADPCFATVIDGYHDEVQRIQNIPAPKEFLENPKEQVLIKEMQIWVPGKGPDAFDGYIEWTPGD